MASKHEVKQLTISVTRWDIWKGIRGNNTYCPVALALRRAFERPVVYVDEDMLQIGAEWTAPTPKCVGRMIARFDQGLNIKPFKFTMKFKRRPVRPSP